jgi:hypothetical protein
VKTADFLHIEPHQFVAHIFGHRGQTPRAHSSGIISWGAL